MKVLPGRTLAKLASEAGAAAVAAAFYDCATLECETSSPNRWFHAASLIKLAVLVAIFDAVEAGRLSLASPVRIDNAFECALDGSPYELETSSDHDSELYRRLGETSTVAELARRMIVKSGNLAANLLLKIVGTVQARKTLRRLGLTRGVQLVRGVGDLKAFSAGVNNRVTAMGVLGLLRAVVSQRVLSPASCSAIVRMMSAQELRDGIPAGLPAGTRVANKTGEMSLVVHDAAVVDLPRRAPYILVVLTEWPGERPGRTALVAAVSRLVYERLAGRGPKST